MENIACSFAVKGKHDCLFLCIMFRCGKRSRMFFCRIPNPISRFTSLALSALKCKQVESFELIFLLYTCHPRLEFWIKPITGSNVNNGGQPSFWFYLNKLHRISFALFNLCICQVSGTVFMAKKSSIQTLRHKVGTYGLGWELVQLGKNVVINKSKSHFLLLISPLQPIYIYF